ncbi:hypothetical protein D3C72_2343490 [compost metagenome]
MARNCGMSFRAAATFWRAPTDRSSAVRRTVGVGAVKPARSIRDAVTTISSMVVGLPADSSSCVWAIAPPAHASKAMALQQPVRWR